MCFLASGNSISLYVEIDIYVEAYIRLNNPDHIPYKFVLCKPLAANW